MGLGKGYLVELRYSSMENGGSTSFFFEDTATNDIGRGVYKSKQFTLTKPSVFYSPNPDADQTWGWGLAQYDLVFHASAPNVTDSINKNVSVLTPFFEYGYQWWGEDYPLQVKAHLSAVGFGVALSSGFRFFF